MNYVSDDDWYLYRRLLPLWQDRYIEKLNKEYIEILNGPSSASDKFWALKKRIDKDSLSDGVFVDASRSMMRNTIMNMLLKKIITLDDIKDFSDELRLPTEGILKAYQEKRKKKRVE